LNAVLQDILRETYTGKGRFKGRPAYQAFAFNYLDDCSLCAANVEEATEIYRWFFGKLADPSSR